LVDEHTGRVVAERSNSKFLAVLLELHRNLYLGAAGDLVLGFVGLCLLASVVSGVVLYGPFMRRIAFGTIRHTSLRLECLDLHNLLGVITLGWVLVVSGTGFVNTLEAPLFGAWQARELPRLLAADAGRAAPLELASLDAVLAAARGALPEMEPTSIGLPGSRFGSEHHFLVWMRGTSRLTSRLFTPVLVDAESGRVSDARGLPWYLRALELARPLHFGDYGGVPLKVLWGLLDLLLLSLLITGAYLWLARASQARSQRARPT
jgi:uncharacterized iron-regulated membrane protein